jgi:hypothetical protein
MFLSAFHLSPSVAENTLIWIADLSNPLAKAFGARSRFIGVAPGVLANLPAGGRTWSLR